MSSSFSYLLTLKFELILTALKLPILSKKRSTYSKVSSDSLLLIDLSSSDLPSFRSFSSNLYKYNQYYSLRSASICFRIHIIRLSSAIRRTSLMFLPPYNSCNTSNVYIAQGNSNNSSHTHMYNPYYFDHSFSFLLLIILRHRLY